MNKNKVITLVIGLVLLTVAGLGFAYLASIDAYSDCINKSDMNQCRQYLYDTILTDSKLRQMDNFEINAITEKRKKVNEHKEFLERLKTDAINAYKAAK